MDTQTQMQTKKPVFIFSVIVIVAVCVFVIILAVKHYQKVRDEKYKESVISSLHTYTIAEKDKEAVLKTLNAGSKKVNQDEWGGVLKNLKQ